MEPLSILPEAGLPGKAHGSGEQVSDRRRLGQTIVVEVVQHSFCPGRSFAYWHYEYLAAGFIELSQSCSQSWFDKLLSCARRFPRAGASAFRWHGKALRRGQRLAGYCLTWVNVGTHGESYPDVAP
jgi:hypothetical protein